MRLVRPNLIQIFPVPIGLMSEEGTDCKICHELSNQFCLQQGWYVKYFLNILTRGLLHDKRDFRSNIYPKFWKSNVKIGKSLSAFYNNVEKISDNSPHYLFWTSPRYFITYWVIWNYSFTIEIEFAEESSHILWCPWICLRMHN